MKHGFFWSDRPDIRRPALPREYLSLQGYPTIPEMHGSELSFPWKDIIDELTSSEVQSLAGNGMHLSILFVVTVYILACSEDVTTSGS